MTSNENQLTVEKDIVNDTKFNGMLTQIKSSGVKTRDLIQEAANQAYLYAMLCHNYERASKLVLIVSESLNIRSANQLRLWFETFAPFAWRKTEDKNYPDGMKFRKSNAKDAKEFLINEAFAKPWYKMEGFTKEETLEIVETIVTTEGIKERITKLVTLMEKALHEEKTDKKVYKLGDDEDKTEVESFIANLKGLTASNDSHNTDQSVIAA